MLYVELVARRPLNFDDNALRTNATLREIKQAQFYEVHCYDVPEQNQDFVLQMLRGAIRAEFILSFFFMELF